MRLYKITRRCSYVAVLITSLLACMVCHAERGGGGYHAGGEINRGNVNDNRNGYYNNDYRDGYRDNGVVVGVPVDGDVGATCQTVQQCDSNGNCTETQSCN